MSNYHIYFKDSLFKYCVYKGKNCVKILFKTRIEAQEYINLTNKGTK